VIVVDNNSTDETRAVVRRAAASYPCPLRYAYFNGTVYFGPIADNIQAFRLTNGLLSTSATSRSFEIYGYPGATLAVSANANANGILWAIQRNGDCGSTVTCGTAAPGVLRAYDATNLSIQLYASDQSDIRDDALDFAAKFSVPLVANGRVYVASMGRLTVYGLLP
jgi:glycosyltransferase involved in cell wall biosynthesis